LAKVNGAATGSGENLNVFGGMASSAKPDLEIGTANAAALAA
jgi:hypothetical protein